MPEYVPEVTRVEVAGRKLRLTSLDKVMYPVDRDHQGRGARLLRAGRAA